MEAIRIDLNDFIHDGEGGIGESLIHNTDKNLMLKLYNTTADRDNIEKELELARKVHSLGIPTPKPGEFVTDGSGRYGMLFERMVDKVSFSRACGNNPQKVEEYARRFARLCKVLHKTEVPEGMFPYIKDYYRSILKANSKIYSEAEIIRINEAIDNAPDGNTAIHGDLQFSNALMVGDKDVFIDLGDFCCGAPEFDLGMVLFTCMYDNVDFLRDVFHMDPETARKFWYYFVKEYYGEDADPNQKEEYLRPYAMLKLLIMERYFGSIPEYHWLFTA